MKVVAGLVYFAFWVFVAVAAFSCAGGANAHSGAPRDVDRAIHKYFGYGPEAGNAFAVADCESSFDARAVNPDGYYGLWQFSASTWRALGGRTNPTRASADEQTKRARRLWAQSGRTFRYHWPVCGAGR